MHISSRTDYAFRMLILVAARSPQLVTISEVAMAYGLSHNHLTKIAHELGKLGYLETVRGRNGGLRLAKPAGEINIGEVARAMEAGTPLVECFDRATNTCRIAPTCGLKFMLADAEKAFFDVLSRHTLAQVVEHPSDILSLLANPSPA